MLEQNLSLEVIKNLTGLSNEELKILKTRIMSNHFYLQKFGNTSTTIIYIRSSFLITFEKI